MTESAILLYRPGRMSFERQGRACMPYLKEHDYILVGKADSHADALALVLNQVAKLVVAARAAPDDWRLERLLAEVDPQRPARLEICGGFSSHNPSGLPGHDTEAIVIRMYERGGTADDIVRLLGVAKERVSRILQRSMRR